LARQALLVAAREELGCMTYDRHLGQVLPEAGCIELDLLGVVGQPSRLIFLKRSPSQTEALGMEDYKTAQEVRVSHLVGTFERLSRVEMVAYLREAGVDGKPRPWVEQAAVPAAVELLLGEMNFVSQWEAARQLHRELDRRGASAELMSALAMAYANLGLLTEYHWNTAHHVFTARALIYAQRLVTSRRRPELGLLTRAYAYALAGAFPAAQQDLKGFEEVRPRDRRVAGNRLELADLLDAYCNYAFEALDPEQYVASHSELASLLQFLAHDFSQMDESREMLGLAAMEKMPHCYRIASSLATRPNVGLGHAATEGAAVMTVTTLYQRLEVIEGLPRAARERLPRLAALQRGGRNQPLAMVADVAKDFQLRSELIEVLRTAKQPVAERHELSWQDLASLIAEHSFQEVFLRAWFVTNMFGSDAEELLDKARPVYEKHPYGRLMETLREGREASDRAREAAKSIDLDTSEFQSLYLLWTYESDPKSKAWSNRIDRNFHAAIDPSVNDLSRLVALYGDYAPFYDRLRGVSVEHPLAQKGMILHHWEDVKKNFDEWLLRAEKNPELFVQIGFQLAAEKRWDEAEEYVRRACQRQPNFSNYRALASVYAKMKDWEEWKHAMELSLTYPTSGLEHADVQQELADHFFRKRRFQQALPFAVGAAEAYSESGLLCAAQCYEALQDWENAEKYYRAAAERYLKTWWYSFTRRTGQGDGQAAREFTSKVLKNPPRNTRSLDAVFYFTLYSGELAAAAQRIEKNWTADTEVLYNGLLYALMLMELKQPDRALLVLRETQRLVDQPGESPRLTRSAGLRSLLVLIEADLSAKGTADLSQAALKKARQRLGADSYLTSFDYFLGYYYELQGKVDEAKRCYVQCMAIPGSMTVVYRTLAGMRLLALGEPPVVYQQALWSGKAAVQ
jgi:tetratricopeptide (TPR) repeat protein